MLVLFDETYARSAEQSFRKLIIPKKKIARIKAQFLKRRQSCLDTRMNLNTPGSFQGDQEIMANLKFKLDRIYREINALVRRM